MLFYRSSPQRVRPNVTLMKLFVIISTVLLGSYGLNAQGMYTRSDMYGSLDCEDFQDEISHPSISYIEHLNMKGCEETVPCSYINVASHIDLGGEYIEMLDLCSCDSLIDVTIHGEFLELPEVVRNHIQVLTAEATPDNVKAMDASFQKLELLRLYIGDSLEFNSTIETCERLGVECWLHFSGNFSSANLERLFESPANIVLLDLDIRDSLFLDGKNWQLESLQTLTINIEWSDALRIDWKKHFPNLKQLNIITRDFKYEFENVSNLKGLQFITVNIPHGVLSEEERIEQKSKWDNSSVLLQSILGSPVIITSDRPYIRLSPFGAE